MRHRRLGLGRVSTVAMAALVLLVVAAAPAAANHSWGSYHWARTANQFTVKLNDSLTSNYDAMHRETSADWSTLAVLDTTILAASDDSRTRKRCDPISGQVRDCNANYGANGWLGLASVWTSGSHITQGTAKMNDSYLASSSYTATNRKHVLCQEIGHTFGLGHQDESGADLDTCMDYANALDNPRPSQHDYDQLEAIYGGHTDSSSTVSTAPTSSGSRKLRRLHDDLYVEDLGRGKKRFVFVVWKEPRLPHEAPAQG